MPEEQFITKTYFKELVDEESRLTPVKSLGELFYDTQMEETDHLSAVRFAQGEVYFHHKDMESAVNKWGMVKGELQQWAKKNIGDAYYEMGWLREAENTYTAIPANNDTLSIEISLQLISLYAEKNNSNKMHQHITKVLSSDPDYPNVTDIARAFYENEQNWQKAVALAVDEALRTSQKKWFTVLTDYANDGATNHYPPDYYENVLLTLAEADSDRFKELVKGLWESYSRSNAYLTWLKTLNTILEKIDIASSDNWQGLISLYEDSYSELMNGQYDLESLKSVIPGVLRHWFRMTEGTDALLPAAAMRAWEEELSGSVYGSPDELDSLMTHTGAPAGMDEGIRRLTRNVLDWAKANDVLIDPGMSWVLADEWPERDHHIIVTGRSHELNTKLINMLAGEEVFHGEGAAVVMSPGAQPALHTVTKEGPVPVDDIKDVQEKDTAVLTWPSDLLKQMNGMLITVPYPDETPSAVSHILEFNGSAADVMYVMDVADFHMEEDYDKLADLYSKADRKPVKVVLMNSSENVTEPVKKRINELFPEFRILTVNESSVKEQLIHHIQPSYGEDGSGVSAARTKHLEFTSDLLGYLLKQRETKESAFREAVTFNKELAETLSGYSESMNEKVNDQSYALTTSFREITEDTKKTISDDIPELLKETADEIDDEGEVMNLHNELNDAMNKRIQAYLSETFMPIFQDGLIAWQNEVKKVMDGLQHNLEEMNEALNGVYDDRQIKLQADFQLLSDWKRDLNRMVNRISLDELNIMNRLTPSQFFLKSAGQVLGRFQRNKQMLVSQYKKYIENDSFDEVTDMMIKALFFEFDLFEKHINADFQLSADEAGQHLKELKNESEDNIVKAEEELKEMQEHPSTFYDPLKTFNIRLNQYERISSGNM